MCAPMNERRYRPGAAVVDGKIYVLGGEEGWDRYEIIWNVKAENIQIECDTSIISILRPHRYHDTIERYCDETDTWEIVGEMPTSRSWLSCVSLQLRKDIHMRSCPGMPNDNWRTYRIKYWDCLCSCQGHIAIKLSPLQTRLGVTSSKGLSTLNWRQLVR